MSYQKTPELVNTPWNSSRLGWLGLAWFEKTGPISLTKLHNYFDVNSGDKAWQSNPKELVQAGLTEKTASEFCEWRDKTNLDNLKKQLDESGIDFILPWDKNYPSILKQTHAPPGGLFWRGALMDNRDWIAVVGTRKISAYGERATKLIVAGLVEQGAGIVSGLALGIDGAAHKATLEAGGKTIAVLGSGIDDASIYPQTHKNLAEQILLNGGSVISEFPPKTTGLKHHFPQRNRIIAGLCRATVVVEADLKSGSVLTAKNALDENRDVFAVPGPITSAGSHGTHELIRNGATICESANDILNTPLKNATPVPSFERDLTMDERNILDLCRTPIHVDDLSRHLNTSPASIASTCMSLELSNALTDAGNQTYELTPTGRALLSKPST
ncbi:MAG: DNA-processing protein DprA [Patescibacteria group bacterium]|nr:DNA-processing protein DprA [Patescibacteria group bacterium]